MKSLSKRCSLLALIATCSLLGACGGVKVLRLDDSRAPSPKPADCELDIYLKDPPKRAYDVFGEIEYKQAVKTMYQGVSTNSGSRREALEALKPKACELGADALMITDEDHDHVNVTASLVVYTGT